MKRLISLAVLLSLYASAAEPVVCTITTSGSSAVTSSPTTGTCSWPAGATVLVQCDQDIYLDSTTVGVTPPTAASTDQRVNFSSNMDPVPVYLDKNDKVIAVIQVSAAGTCKFMTTLRKKPWSK